MNVECGHLGQRIRLAECILRRSAGHVECLKCSMVFGRAERGHGPVKKVEDMAEDMFICQKCHENQVLNDRGLCPDCMDRVSFDGELDKYPVGDGNVFSEKPKDKAKPKKKRAASIKELEARVAALEKAVFLNCAA
jgi:hypothetical protein